MWGVRCRCRITAPPVDLVLGDPLGQRDDEAVRGAAGLDPDLARVRVPLMVPVAVTSPCAVTVSRASTLPPPWYRPNLSTGGSPPIISTG